MVALMPPQTVLTPARAANDLQTKGLDVLGLTVPNLSPVWAGGAPGAYDPAALTLQVTGLRAPFRGIREFTATPVDYSGVDGKPLAGPAAVMRMHPEAERRLVRLVEARLGATPAIHPVPASLVVRGVTIPATVPVPEWFFCGDVVDTPGTVTLSFHDNRGLPICPIAVAWLFAELLTWRPALYVANGAAQAVGDPGGLTAIKALATGTRVHVIDPHGWGYVPTRDIVRLKVTDGANAQVAPVTDSGLVDLAAGQGLGRSAADDTADGANRPLRWGFATTGTLARTRLVPPALPAGVTLTRQFLRVMAVDLDWHLRGNRNAAPVAGIPADDQTTPAFLLPAVRDPVPNFAYLPDAQEVGGVAAAMVAGFGAQASLFAAVASPIIDDTAAVPPSGGPSGHWPAFPAFASPQPISPATQPVKGLVATRRAAADGANADRDVIVTIAAGNVPDGAHVRVFPRRFQAIAAIGDIPSFIRPDGGAAIAQTGAATKVLLVNAFGLGLGDVFPNPPNLALDMVVTDRNGRRKMFSQVTILVAPGPESATGIPANFGGAPVLGAAGLKGVLDGLGMRGVAASPLFGVPRTVPLPSPGGSAVSFARAMASETQPRQGPRLPTMMRFDSVLAIGSAAAAGTPLAWSAVLSGVRFTSEMRSFRPDLGNPGNPAGADVHATGIRCDGFLARDLALHAVKRAQPIIPLGGTTSGWVVATGGNNWNPPPADTTGTVAAVMLETVAAICDTPELSIGAIPEPQAGDTVQALIDSAASALGVPTVTVNVTNANEIVRRVQREIVTAKHGQRDALWALRRAFGQARELIYIESPGLARTARPAGPPAPHEIDLIDVIRAQLVANPRLKVILCTPRLPDFDASRQGWARTAFAHRKQAVLDLTAAAQARVAAFHPIGFPGRASPMRSTTVIVDDAWCLTGTSHLRRRGMTFDGGVDVVSLDRAIARGYSASIARFRQTLMAEKLGVDVPSTVAAATALWVRLARPESAFGAVAELLTEGGLGRIAPIWAGPTDTSVLPQTDNVADPDGAAGASFATFIAAAVSGE
jgi:hypothetical protein